MNFGQATINQILDILQNINTVETQTTPTCNVPCQCPSGQQESSFCNQGEKAELAGTVSCWPCTNPDNKTCYKCVPETPCCNCTTCAMDLFDPPEENTPCKGCAIADKCDKCQVAGLPIFCFKCPTEENKPACNCTDERCINLGFFDSREKCKQESGAEECRTESCSHNCCKGSVACYKPCSGNLPTCACTNCGQQSTKEDCESVTGKKCKKVEIGCQTYGADCCKENKDCWEPCDNDGDPCDCETCGYYNDEQECLANSDGLRCAKVDCEMNQGTNSDPCCKKNSNCWKECQTQNNTACPCSDCGYKTKSDCEAQYGRDSCNQVTCSPKNPNDCCKENQDCWEKAPPCKCEDCGYITKAKCEIDCYGSNSGCCCDEAPCYLGPGSPAAMNCVRNDDCAIKKSCSPSVTTSCKCTDCTECPGHYGSLNQCNMEKEPWEKCIDALCSCEIPGCSTTYPAECYIRDYDPSNTVTPSITLTPTPTKDKCPCSDCNLWNSKNQCESDNPGKICVDAHCEAEPNDPCLTNTGCFDVNPVTPTPTPTKCIYGFGEYRTKAECDAALKRQYPGACQCKTCIDGQETSSGLDPQDCKCAKIVNKENMTSDTCCKDCCGLTQYYNSKEECENIIAGQPRECKQATSCGQCTNCSSKCWTSVLLTPTNTNCAQQCNNTSNHAECDAWALQGIGRKCERADCPDKGMVCYNKVQITPTGTCACKDIGQGCMSQERCNDLASPQKCPVGPEQGKRCECQPNCGNYCSVGGVPKLASDQPCAELVERALRCGECQEHFNTSAQCETRRQELQRLDPYKLYKCKPQGCNGDDCYAVTEEKRNCCKNRPSDCQTKTDCQKPLTKCSGFCRVGGVDCYSSGCKFSKQKCTEPGCDDINLFYYDCYTASSECLNCQNNKTCCQVIQTPSGQKKVPKCVHLSRQGAPCTEAGSGWQEC